MQSKPLLGEYIHVLRKKEIKVHCYNSHSKLPYLFKVISLTLFFILWGRLWCCILVILRSSYRCLLPIHRIRRRRIVLWHRSPLWLWIGHVDDSGLIIGIMRATAAMMLMPFILLGHHHHILHIHHILILQLNKWPHGLILILLSRGQVSFKPQLFYLVLNSTYLFDQFRLVIRIDIGRG